MNFKRKAIYKILNSMAEKQLDKNGNMKKAGPQIVEPKKGGIAKTSEFLKDVGATLASYIITTKDLDAIREYMLENPLPEDASKVDKNKSAIVALAVESISLMKYQRTKEYKKHLDSIAESERAKQQPITDTIEDERYDSTTPVDEIVEENPILAKFKQEHQQELSQRLTPEEQKLYWAEFDFLLTISDLELNGVSFTDYMYGGETDRKAILKNEEAILSPSIAPLNLEDTNTRDTNNDNRDTRGRN